MRSLVSIVACGLIVSSTLTGCAALDEAMCSPNCHSQSSSSSLVSFLYGDVAAPPRQDSIPELHLPLRVGLAFLPPRFGADYSLTAADQEALLERIRARFAGKTFVRDITIIPDYYLANSRGFSGLQGLQRLYNVDLVALVSYDQVTNQDDNKLSIGYLTIVGAYVLKGSRHDLTTLMDLAVVDPATRSLVLRAGGTDTRRGDSTLVDQDRDIRDAAVASFAAATDQTIEHFDAALTQFEGDVRAGKANVRITREREPSSDSSGPASHSYGGSLSPAWLIVLSGSALLQVRRRRRDRLSLPNEHSAG